MKSTYLPILNSGLILIIVCILIFNSIKEDDNEISNDKNINPQQEQAVQSNPIAIEKISSDELDFSNLKIAFVNSDTVSTYYEFAKDVQASLLKKQSSAEKQIKNKYKEYEKMVGAYQQSAKIMGQSEAQEKGQQIALLEQEIMQLEQSLNQKLTSEELKITSDYVIQTNSYMQGIGKQLGFDYVLSYRMGGPMLYANPELDITNKVIELLNIEYKAN